MLYGQIKNRRVRFQLLTTRTAQVSTGQTKDEQF